MNVPNGFNREGIEGEILWHLADIKKRLLKEGRLPLEYVGVPLPEIRIGWRQSKQGKGKTKAEPELSLNNLASFQDNGCKVLYR